MAIICLHFSLIAASVHSLASEMEAGAERRVPAAAAVVGLLLLLLSATRSGWRSKSASRSATSRAWPASAAAACRHWASVAALPGSCLGQLAPGAAFNCCAGSADTCKSCTPEVLAHLRCLSPSRMLLRPAPGCGHLLAPQLPAALWQPGPRRAPACALSTAAIANGSWAAPAEAEAAPAMPEVLFRLAAGPGSGSKPSDGGAVPACTAKQQLRRLGAAEAAPRCLWSAGYQRVLISGDSSVRQLFNRLVALLRQQNVAIDGGGMQHAHYALHLWRDAAPLLDGGLPGLSTDPGASGGGGGGGAAGASGSSSGDAAGADVFATDQLWYSPTGDAAQEAGRRLRVCRACSAALLPSPPSSRPSPARRSLLCPTHQPTLSLGSGARS